MNEIQMTVNGREVTAEEGDTILEACEDAGIEIPTLCHYDDLTDVGACRMCTVQIDGDRLETACTTPVQDGIEIETHNDELRKHRKMLLELICAEENHYCMYCDMDGDCELQDLLKEYGVDHVSIPYSYKSYPVDSVSEHLVIDHNRCILCGRCIRVCEEVVSNDTLDFGGRGQDTKVVADLNRPLGESTCISCGACMQVCPTGTIFSKHSAYRGNTKECESSETVCTECSVGCGREVFTRSRNLVQIYGTEVEGPSGGQLCERGRFDPLTEERERVTSAYLNDGEVREEIGMEEALERAGAELGRADRVAGMVSDRLPTESLSAFENLMESCGGSFDVPGADGIRSFERAKEEEDLPSLASSSSQLLEADKILVFDSSIVDTHPVIAAYVRRASKEGAELMVVDIEEDRLDRYSDGFLKLESEDTPLAESVARSMEDESDLEEPTEAGLSSQDLTEVKSFLAGSKRSFLLAGARVEDVSSLKGLLHLARVSGGEFLRLNGVSNQAVAELSTEDLEGEFDLCYLLAADDEDLEEMKEVAGRADFLIVQAARESELTEEADLVLPARAWFERGGSFVDVDGEEKTVKAVLEPRFELEEDGQLLRVSDE